MARTSASILVVEDEPLVRMVVVEELALVAFAVTEVDSGAAALKVAQSAPEMAAAVIDVGLPDARGDEVAKQIRQHWPNAVIVLVSGYDEDFLREHMVGYERVAYLSKPYLASDLIDLLGRFDVRPRHDS